MDFSITGIIAHFTPVTWLIFWVLLIMSVLSLSVAINRGVVFWRASKQSRLFAETVASALAKADVDKVLVHAAAEEVASSYLARIVRDGLKDARDLKSKGIEDLATVDAAMLRAVSQEGQGHSKWLTILATVASTAPFVGLLGTVFGIINSFVGMASSGSGGLGAVAGGIAEALVMTGLGLFVAIPAVWLYNWANAGVDKLAHEMANSQSEMLDWIRKNWATV